MSAVANETDKNMKKSTNGARSVAAKSVKKSSGVQGTVTTAKTSNAGHVEVSKPDKTDASADVGSKATSSSVTAAEENLQPDIELTSTGKTVKATSNMKRYVYLPRIDILILLHKN